MKEESKRTQSVNQELFRLKFISKALIPEKRLDIILKSLQFDPISQKKSINRKKINKWKILFWKMKIYLEVVRKLL
jgi:hypothetical protein